MPDRQRSGNGIIGHRLLRYAALPHQIFLEHGQRDRLGLLALLVHLVDRTQHVVADAELRHASLRLGWVKRECRAKQRRAKVGLQARGVGCRDGGHEIQSTQMGWPPSSAWQPPV